MGITIYYNGRLATHSTYDQFIEYVYEFAQENNWDIVFIRKKNAKRDYICGPTKGLKLRVCEWFDPVTFEFDDQLHMCNYQNR